MKTIRIAIVTTILLITACVSVFGQVGNLSQDISKLSPEEKRAYLNSINIKIKELENDTSKLNEVLNKSQEGKKAVNQGDLSHGKCKTDSAFHGDVCNETNQEKETEENPISDAKETQAKIKKNLELFIRAVESYNSDWKEWNSANPADSNLQKETSKKLAESANKALGYGSLLINDTTVSPNLKSEVSKVNRKMEISSSVDDDLKSLQGFFENDCDKCSAK